MNPKPYKNIKRTYSAYVNNIFCHNPRYFRFQLQNLTIWLRSLYSTALCDDNITYFPLFSFIIFVLILSSRWWHSFLVHGQSGENFMLPPPPLPHALPPCCKCVHCLASCLYGQAWSFYLGTRSHLSIFISLRTSLWKFSSLASSISLLHWIISMNIMTIMTSTFVMLSILLCTVVH